MMQANLVGPTHGIFLIQIGSMALIHHHLKHKINVLIYQIVTICGVLRIVILKMILFVKYQKV